MDTKNARGCGKCTYTQPRLSRLQSGNIYIYIHTCMCMNVTTVDKRRYHEYEREHGGACTRVWEEERKGENAVIILRCPQIKDLIKQMQE